MLTEIAQDKKTSICHMQKTYMFLPPSPFVAYFWAQRDRMKEPFCTGGLLGGKLITKLITSKKPTGEANSWEYTRHQPRQWRQRRGYRYINQDILCAQFNLFSYHSLQQMWMTLFHIYSCYPYIPNSTILYIQCILYFTVTNCWKFTVHF